ncbi:tetratricopeptide repeat protein [Novilysobacter erysipheiresistens]|uniref:Uncharacterized protein n=1 Tax=Novilysobacter erysipheiresistens TaxID=1749332 RepID=A0ABU7YXE0_9GAMM
MEWLKRLFGSILRGSSRGRVAIEVAADTVVAPREAPQDAVDDMPVAVAEDAAVAVAAPVREPAREPGPEVETRPTPIATARVETTEIDPAAPPVLRPALAAFGRGEFKSALAVAAAQVDHRDAGVRNQAHRLCAQSLAGLKRWDDAFDHWLALFDDQPSAYNALQLATTSVMCDEAERGEAWLERFDQLNARDLPPALARSEFLAALAARGRMSLALPHLQWLRDVYLQLHGTDPAFLQQRGVPSFEAFLADSLPILRGALSPLDVRSWYSALDGRLDERGQQHLQQWIAGLAQAA